MIAFGGVWLFRYINYMLASSEGPFRPVLWVSAVLSADAVTSVGRKQPRDHMHYWFQTNPILQTANSSAKCTKSTYGQRTQEIFFLASECGKRVCFHRRRSAPCFPGAGPQGQACQGETVSFKRSRQSRHSRLGHTMMWTLSWLQC